MIGHLFFSILMSCSTYYFGYGSNLNSDFLRERLKDGEWLEDGWHKSGEYVGPDPVDLGTYILPNYQFGYTLDLGQTTPGNITSNRGSTVYGALYRITKEQLDILDKDEDLGTDYERVALKVNRVAESSFNQAPAEVEAEVYVAYSHCIAEQIRPEAEYVKLLVEAARKRKFPETYIETYLKAEPCLISQ